MICLCKCKGSNLIHLKCLSLQLHNSLEETQMNYNPGVSYTVKKYNCEICKEPYPINVKYKDQIFRLLDYSLPEKTNSIVLVSLNSIKENEYPLSVHLLIFIENSSQFYLGRGQDCDVKISDISVSRKHARIRFENNEIILEDVGSKFGTLVLANEEVEINENVKTLQIGRSLIKANVASGSYENSDNQLINNNINFNNNGLFEISGIEGFEENNQKLDK